MSDKILLDPRLYYMLTDALGSRGSPQDTRDFDAAFGKVDRNDPINRKQFLTNMFKDNREALLGTKGTIAVVLAVPNLKPRVCAATDVGTASNGISLIRYEFRKSVWRTDTHTVQTVTCEGITVSEEITYHDVRNLGRRNNDTREF